MKKYWLTRDGNPPLRLHDDPVSLEMAESLMKHIKILPWYHGFMAGQFHTVPTDSVSKWGQGVDADIRRYPLMDKLGGRREDSIESGKLGIEGSDDEPR